MAKSDKILFWFASLLVFETIPTWFNLGWYWFDLSVASIIATLVLCMVFLAETNFIERVLIFIYFIKLTNIIGLYAAYAVGSFPKNNIIISQMDLLNLSKPALNVMLYLYFLISFIKYVNGWNYNNKSKE